MVARLGMPGAGGGGRVGGAKWTGCGRPRLLLRRAARAAGGTLAARPLASEQHEVPGECGRGAGRPGRAEDVSCGPSASLRPQSYRSARRVSESLLPRSVFRPPAAHGAFVSHSASATPGPWHGPGCLRLNPRRYAEGSEKPRFAEGCRRAASRDRLGLGVILGESH